MTRIKNCVLKHKNMLVVLVALAAAALFGWWVWELLGLDKSYEPPDPRLETVSISNRDALAWLTIPDTHIDASVQQGPDNTYYLRRDDEGKPDFHGCLFADYESNLSSCRTLSDNTIIYGHTYSSGKYVDGFYDLKSYLENDFAEKHPYIYLSLQDGQTVWQVASAGIAQVEMDTDCIYADLDDEQREAVIRKAKERSVVDFGVEINDSDKLLTLSTCTGYDDFRLLVVAKLIDQEKAR